tara:strand:+ start:1547 stop:2935 length:1389 start_codon:yes stop_codon:yes gene_type:complete
MAGSSTELYSEVLAQICLAYSIDTNKALTREVLIDGSTLNKKIMSSIKNLMIFHSVVNLNSKSFVTPFIEYIKGNVSGKLNWVDAQGRNMLAVKKRFNINRQHKIYNDKLFGSTPSDNNPYTAFLKSKTGISTDKWNPADIWSMNLDGRTALKRLNRRVRARSKVSLEYCNQFLADQFSKGNIIPISLKKPQASPHMEIINSNEFVSRVTLGATNNPTVEYDYKNKDVKINFTIETVELPKGTSARRARGKTNISGTVVRGSQKHIRLKYHVDNKKVELEYTQTRQPSRAAAKMGNLGAKNFQNIINNTSRSGVSKLNSIQRNFKDIDLKTSPWFNGQQLGVTKARKEEEKIAPQFDRLSEYVSTMWKEINGSLPDFAGDKTINTPSGMWSKARAGELGLAIHAIPNKQVQKRVIQNLYEAAAAISYVTGLNREEMEMEKALGMDPSARKTEFNASVYVKVF